MTMDIAADPAELAELAEPAAPAELAPDAEDETPDEVGRVDQADPAMSDAAMLKAAASEAAVPDVEPGRQPEPADDEAASVAAGSTDAETEADTPQESAESVDSARPEPTRSTPPTKPTAVPTPRPEAEADGEQERGKVKKGRKAVRAAKSAVGTKALVVWKDGKVQYADENVLVVDLDEAASPDLDVHEVVDRLAELREAAETPGRADAVTALAEIIQDKALN